MRWPITAIFMALLLSGCNRASSLSDAGIPNCATSRDLGNKSGYRVAIDDDCWKTFVEAVSKSAGGLCRKQLMSGEGCEFNTAKGEFILSPLAGGEDNEKVFILTDLSH